VSVEQVRVVVVDEQALVREGIASILAPFDDIVVVGAVAELDEAVELCGEVTPDVALLSAVPPGAGGAAAVAQLRRRHPALLVVVVTGHVDDLFVREVVEAGANACLRQDVGVEELADAIRTVSGGRSVFSSDFLPQLLGHPTAEGHRASLTARERDVLPLLAAGMTNRAIAGELGLTPGTVRMYVSAILTKLGAANRTEASVVAIRQRLVHIDVTRPSVPGTP
jgi:NarL family two-component system response regulator LiaR